MDCTLKPADIGGYLERYFSYYAYGWRLDAGTCQKIGSYESSDIDDSCGTRSKTLYPSIGLINLSGKVKKVIARTKSSCRCHFLFGLNIQSELVIEFSNGAHKTMRIFKINASDQHAFDDLWAGDCYNLGRSSNETQSIRKVFAVLAHSELLQTLNWKDLPADVIACSILPNNKFLLFTGDSSAQSMHIFGVPKLPLHQKLATLALKKYHDMLADGQRRNLEILSGEKLPEPELSPATLPDRAEVEIATDGREEPGAAGPA